MRAAAGGLAAVQGSLVLKTAGIRVRRRRSRLVGPFRRCRQGCRILLVSVGIAYLGSGVGDTESILDVIAESVVSVALNILNIHYQVHLVRINNKIMILTH
ncbi:hypothetical protein AVEN_148034-1 [Araneus ventricosus]|uniref:Uncharacterized protein n=1 Tax=Araneus ventricosus TaxID=182803 RepID=A0A4Y2JYT2_ARAVE|nr:hypothetical protein AVEN_148034-1 [Araneus ventricosus]